MGTPTGTLALSTEHAGDWKLLIVDFVPVSASDTVTLTLATHGVREIKAAMPQLLTGQDAALQTILVSDITGLVITVVTETSGGGAATDWGSATARLWIIAR